MGKLTINCCLCSNSHSILFENPEGWSPRYDFDWCEEDGAFCPDHAIISEFTENQCGGCVGGWGDCDLWQGFAYPGRRSLTDDDFKKLESGACPKRTNGTFSVSSHGMEKIDLSKTAPPASGAALSQAIKDYWERYPEWNPSSP